MDKAAFGLGCEDVSVWPPPPECPFFDIKHSFGNHAVQGALAFLKVAERVPLVEIAENVVEWAAQQQLDDVERYLARHGVKVSKKVVEEPKRLGL
jgi:hypothetical protein